MNVAPQILCLNNTFKDQEEFWQEQSTRHAQAYDSLKEQIIELRRHRFGKRSERYIDPENPQLSLFQDNEAIFSQADSLDETAEETTEVAAHIRKKKKKTEKELPRRIEELPVLCIR